MDEEFFKINPAIFHKTVTRDLLIPVYSIAYESAKTEPLLKDNKALEIKDTLDHLSCLCIECRNDLEHYRLILMKLCFDRLIKDFIWRHPNGTIINIGCGLDTTFERIKADNVQWYDLDYPEVIGFRKLFIDETEKRRFISASFLKSDWYDNIRTGESLLVFASGIFCYYRENMVRNFFSKLGKEFPTFELLFDVISPAGVRLTNLLNRKKEMIKCPRLKWGVDDYRNIIGWNPRLKFLGRYLLFEQNRFKIPLKFLFPGLICDALSMYQILHLKVRYDYRRLQS